MNEYKYIIMCGGTYTKWDSPRHLLKINGEMIIERTIQLLKENGVSDISISTNNPVFEQFGLPILHHVNEYNANGYNDFTGNWNDAFYLMKEPVCYIFGDVVFSPKAIKTIVETETDDIEFFASAPPFSEEYLKDSAEPFAVKVVNNEHFEWAIHQTNFLNQLGKFERKPIMWELWQVIKDTPINKIDYTNYTVINDYTCDVDEQKDIELIEKVINKIRFKVHSYYDDFPDNHPVEGLPYIECYVGDFCAFDKVKPGSIAVMLEPRSIEHKGYEYVEKHSEEFKYIFTHDSKLLKLPNAYYWVWGSVWCTADVPKTKGISMISSHKACCELHIARTDLARYFESKGKVDCYGTYNDPEGKKGFVDTYKAHAEYRFAIAMENYIDDGWFTEKILNCFSTKTIPIYYGARDIGKYFNPDGIIQVDDWHKIPEIVENLNVDEEYTKRIDAVNDNFERVKMFEGRWCDRFFESYEDILREIL